MAVLDSKNFGVFFSWSLPNEPMRQIMFLSEKFQVTNKNLKRMKKSASNTYCMSVKWPAADILSNSQGKSLKQGNFALCLSVSLCLRLSLGVSLSLSLLSVSLCLCVCAGVTSAYMWVYMYRAEVIHKYCFLGTIHHIFKKGSLISLELTSFG